MCFLLVVMAAILCSQRFNCFRLSPRLDPTDFEISDEAYIHGYKDVVHMLPAGNWNLTVALAQHNCPWTCRSVVIFAWLRSPSAIVAPVSLVPVDAQSAGQGLLTGTFHVEDAGQYVVEVVSLRKVRSGPGNHDTRMHVRHLLGSGRMVVVVRNNSVDTTESKTGDQIPLCNPESSSGPGRWVSCNALSPGGCLRDGWIWKPFRCSHSLDTAQSTLRRAQQIAHGRGGKPLWIVFMGSSVLRGSMHSLVDFIGGAALHSVFTLGNSTRGVGSIVKCWGWFDVLIESMRVSYQDFRVSHYPNSPALLASLVQIMIQQPDLIVLETHIGGGRKASINQYWNLSLKAYQVSQYTGKMILTPQKLDTASGGAQASYCEDLRIDSLTRFRQDLLSNVRRLPSLAPHEGFLELVSEDAMSWPFIFDMEKALKSSHASHHWHRYTAMSSKLTERHVFGAVAEMSGRAYVEMLLHHIERGQKSVSSLTNASRPFVQQRRVAICAACPKHSCCPWKEPVPSPNNSLSTAHLLREWLPLEDVHLSGCGSNYLGDAGCVP